MLFSQSNRRLETWVDVGVAGGTALLGGIGANKEKKRQKQADELANVSAAAERDRDRMIGVTRQQIDQAIDAPARQQQYATYANALRGYFGEQLGRRKLDTSRNLKFALARGGQTGGSVAVDTGRRLGDEFSEAALGAERQVQGSVAGLKSADEQTRNQLKALATQGLDATTAGRRALEGTQQNLAQAGIDSRAKGLGDVFADTAATYKTINERGALRRGYGYSANRADLYGSPR